MSRHWELKLVISYCEILSFVPPTMPPGNTNQAEKQNRVYETIRENLNKTSVSSKALCYFHQCDPNFTVFSAFNHHYLTKYNRIFRPTFIPPTQTMQPTLEYSRLRAE